MKIRLSQRNLLSLLHKLEMPGSVRTIIKATDDGEEVLIEAVTDEECYAGRDPGPMHPETEIFVSLLARALKIVRRQVEGESPTGTDASPRVASQEPGYAPQPDG